MKNIMPGIVTTSSSSSVENGLPSKTSGSAGEGGIHYPSISIKQKNGGRREDANNCNGFEEWGGYMEAKIAKLDEQFHNSKTKLKNRTGDNDAPPAIFNGICIHVNGYTFPPEPELRSTFVKYGGTYHQYRNSRTDFVIASNLSASSKALYAACAVKPEWITDSVAAGKKLNHREYLLYNLNEEKNQRTLTQMMVQPIPKTVLNHTKESPDRCEMSVSCTTNGYKNNEYKILSPVEDESKIHQKSMDACNQSEVNFDPSTLAANNVTTGRKIKTAAEEGFLEDFFQNSRLHLISDQKKEMQDKIGNMRKALDTHAFEYLEEFINSSDQNNNYSDTDILVEPVTLMHIDLDCFFVSVGLLSRPHLRDKPVVVTHSTGNNDNSMSDIASASYEARKFGIKNGMWVSDAKKLCPELQVIPYDFDEYRRVSNTFFDVLSRITLDIEPGSVDEMVIDATSVLKKVSGSSPTDLAEFIRKKVFDVVNCTVSVGIGSNRLLAKLATKKAKPNGVYHLKTEDAVDFIQELEVRELPGIGWSHESKLNELFKVNTCKDLLMIPIHNLRNEFGAKTADKMIRFCKGIDSTELKYGFDRPKSISVDVNYGIRFTNEDQLSEFFMKLSKELSSRVSRAQASGSNLTVKIMSRKKGAGDPKKHGGHGSVDITTRSTRLFQPTNDWNAFFRMVSKVTRLLTIPPADYRGIGLSLTELIFEFDKSSNQKKAVQTTLFDLASSRGRQMLEFARKSANKRGAVIPDDKSEVCETASTIDSSHASNTNPIVACPSPPQSSPNNFRFPQPKRRKLNFNIDSEKIPPKSDPSAVNDDVDLNVLRELPEDIAREIAQQYKIDFSLVQQMPNPYVDRTNLESDITSRPAQGGSNNEKQISGGDISNPYLAIDAIDPTYLVALPEAIRNEVLLQFQEAKGHKIDESLVVGANVAQDQPCSSKQALERYNALQSNIVKDSMIAQSKAKNPPSVFVKSSDLVCNEQMCDEIVYTTPPKNRPPAWMSTSPRKFPNRRNASTTPLSSKRRINLDENGSTKTPIHPGAEPVDMNKLFKDKPYRPYPRALNQIVTLPTLHGIADIEDVRNRIRHSIAAVSDPEFDGPDAKALHQYFYDLIARGYIKQGQLLLKFLCRKYQSLPKESQWRSIIKQIVTVVQAQCIELFTFKLDLKL